MKDNNVLTDLEKDGVSFSHLRYITLISQKLIPGYIKLHTADLLPRRPCFDEFEFFRRDEIQHGFLVLLKSVAISSVRRIILKLSTYCASCLNFTWTMSVDQRYSLKSE